MTTYISYMHVRIVHIYLNLKLFQSYEDIHTIYTIYILWYG